MSSPARSSASATSAGGQGGGVSGNAGFGDETSSYHFPTDVMSAHDRKGEALAALKSELMAALQKEVKSLDEDSWKFARPRSQIHLISRPGGHQHKFTGRDGNVNHLFKQTRDI
ncbi:protein SAMBA-like [Phoenix dactylifera]|uniref:Protein SAMBA n=1 Tax=Phoenix dactylifera TaxID=42345 RepID=A0A8B7BH65_PHODC|nr:protein SAMBA [Phoenix dactylifera]XP_038982320.1 protein SAMBA-like [Phoenix dactylifera]